MSARLRALVSLLLPFAVGSPAHAAPGDTVGVEFQVNTYTTGRQSDPDVAGDGAGGFVVVWETPAAEGDTDGEGIWARRFDAAGAPLGNEFQVNTWTTGYQSLPEVLTNGSQGFVVVWQSAGGSPGTDTDADSVQAQFFDTSGTPIGTELQVNMYTTGFQSLPAVTPLADGFVVVWQSSGSSGTDASEHSIHGQRFDTQGEQVGSEFQVNTYTTGVQRNPGVAPLTGGGFVAWASAGSAGTDTSDLSIQAQRYDAQGQLAGGQFQVNAYTNATQGYPGVVADGAGGFVVQWYSEGSFGTDTSGQSVQVRRFDAQGTPQGAEFQVNTYTTGNQFGYTAGPDEAGGFVVVWESSGSPGTDTSEDSIQARRFNADWQPVSDQFQVNTATTDGQNFPNVAPDGAGGIVIVWRTEDGDETEIRAQRFEGTSIATTTTTTPTTTSTSTSTSTTTSTSTPSSTPTTTSTSTSTPTSASSSTSTTTSTSTPGTASTSTSSTTTSTLATASTSTSTPGAATTTTTLLPGEPLEGRKLELATKPGDPGKSKLALLSTDGSVGIGRSAGSADDPVLHGGALSVSSVAGDFAGTYQLAGEWKYAGKASEPKGYKWKSRTSAIRAVVLKSGRLVIVGKGSELRFDLDDDPMPVRVALAVGARRYCLEFGGATPKFKPNRLYRAKLAAAPAACP